MSAKVVFTAFFMVAASPCLGSRYKVTHATWDSEGATETANATAEKSTYTNLDATEATKEELAHRQPQLGHGCPAQAFAGFIRRAPRGACGIKYAAGRVGAHERCICVGKQLADCYDYCKADGNCVGFVQTVESVQNRARCEYATTSTCPIGICSKFNVGNVGPITEAPWGNSYTTGCFVKEESQTAANLAPTPVSYCVKMEPGSYSSEVSWKLDDGRSFRYASEREIQISTGSHTLTMKDSYGDGWNGATWSLCSSCSCSKVLFGPYTIEGSAGQETFTIQTQAATECPANIVLSGAGAQAGIQASRVGSYTKTNLSRDGRPIYQQGNGCNYLYYWSEFGLWKVGLDYNSDDAGITSQRNFQWPCPSNVTSWSQWTGSSWVEDDSITCVTQGSPAAISPGPVPCAIQCGNAPCEEWRGSYGTRIYADKSTGNGCQTACTWGATRQSWRSC